MLELDPELRRRVAAARVVRLTTVRPDATPHIVPITFALAGRSLVTAVHHDKPKHTTALQRLRNIAANPAVSVLIDHYDDWNQLWWVRADGTATIWDAEAAPDASMSRLRSISRTATAHRRGRFSW